MTKRSGYDVPVVPLPAAYKNSTLKDTPASAVLPDDSAAKQSATDYTQNIEMAEWWRAFGNPELVALIDRGLANNPDLRIATEQMAQAKTRVDQALAGTLPTITAPIQMAGGTVSPGISSVSQKSYQASLQGSWRIDLWGERSSMADSAKFQLWQAAFNRDNVQRNMTASLASSYVEFLSLNDRLRVARETEVVLTHMLDSLEKRVSVGDATLIELDQQKASIFSVRTTIPTLEQQREDALTSIAFLVGTVPSSLHLSNDGLDTLFLPSVIPALPSALLLRRPDVRMAEARLLSADADVDAARARILPSMDLSSQIGHSNTLLSQLLQPSSLFWNAIASITTSVFDGGKLKSDKENAKAVHEEMVETYARTIYQAAKEVESALAAIRLSSNRLDSQKEATNSAQRVWENSAKVYAVGSLDYQSLLDAEHNYNRYLDELMRMKKDNYHGYISLFQALGGGVKFASQLPGKGVRPAPVKGDALGAVALTVQKTGPDGIRKNIVVEGVDWDTVSEDERSPLKAEKFWQVELPGLYHRSTIAAAWRDLRIRYPKLMEGRLVRPLPQGSSKKEANDPMSLFRLYVSKFETPELAQELCSAFKENYQRCRVISSRSDETVVEKRPTGTIRKQAENKTISVLSMSSVLSQPEISVEAKPELPAGGNVSISDAHDVFTANESRTAKEIPSSLEEGKLAYTVQLGAFASIENATTLQAFWRSREYLVYVSEIKDSLGNTRFAVRSGLFNTKREATAIARIFKRKEAVAAIVVQTSVNKSGFAVDDLARSTEAKAIENKAHLSDEKDLTHPVLEITNG